MHLSAAQYTTLTAGDSITGFLLAGATNNDLRISQTDGTYHITSTAGGALTITINLNEGLLASTDKAFYACDDDINIDTICTPGSYTEGNDHSVNPVATDSFTTQAVSGCANGYVIAVHIDATCPGVV